MGYIETNTEEMEAMEAAGLELLEGIDDKVIVIDVRALDPISGMQEIADRLRDNFTSPDNQARAQYIADSLNEHLGGEWDNEDKSHEAIFDTFESLIALASVEGHALEILPVPGVFALMLDVYPSGEVYGTVYLHEGVVTYKVEVENGETFVINPVLTDEDFDYLSGLGRFTLIGASSVIINPEHAAVHQALNDQLAPLLAESEAGDNE